MNSNANQLKLMNIHENQGLQELRKHARAVVMGCFPIAGWLAAHRGPQQLLGTVPVEGKVEHSGGQQQTTRWLHSCHYSILQAT